METSLGTAGGQAELRIIPSRALCPLPSGARSLPLLLLTKRRGLCCCCCFLVAPTTSSTSSKKSRCSVFVSPCLCRSTAQTLSSVLRIGGAWGSSSLRTAQSGERSTCRGLPLAPSPCPPRSQEQCSGCGVRGQLNFRDVPSPTCGVAARSFLRRAPRRTNRQMNKTPSSQKVVCGNVLRIQKPKE